MPRIQADRLRQFVQALLQSRRRPIVLLHRRPDAPVASEVAPGNQTLGVMLPYTPLQFAVRHAEEDGAPADETTPVALGDMVGHYKRSKFLAEQAVRELIERERLPVVIVNPSMPVGPRDSRPTPSGRVILQAAKGRIPAYVDTGLNVVHVEDVARGHLLAFERGRIGEGYILGGENLPLGQILGLVAKETGRRPPRIRLRQEILLPFAHLAEALARITRSAEPMLTVDGLRMSRKRMYFTSGKAGRELGYTSRRAESAVRDAVEWYRRHGFLG
jgi:dihydroflavonol-4-reductase